MASHGIAGYPTKLASPYTFKPGAYSSHSRLLALLPRAMGGERVLDVGCGPGYLCEALCERGYRVTGIERAGWGPPPDGARGYSLVEADLDGGLPPLDGQFDAIVCADILEHLRDPLSLLRQLRERLAPGGRLIASLPNSGHLYFRLVVLSGRFPRRDKGLFDRTHAHFFTWDGWMDLFRDSGLAVGEVQSTAAPIGLAFPGHENSFAMAAAERLSYLLARLRKQLFAYQFVVVAARNETR